jgi:hypothetical protein
MFKDMKTGHCYCQNCYKNNILLRCFWAKYCICAWRWQRVMLILVKERSRVSKCCCGDFFLECLHIAATSSSQNCKAKSQVAVTVKGHCVPLKTCGRVILPAWKPQLQGTPVSANIVTAGFVFPHSFVLTLTWIYKL